MIIYNVELNLFINRIEQFIVEYGHKIDYHLGTHDPRKNTYKSIFKVVTFEGNEHGYYSNKFGISLIAVNKRFAEMDFKIAEDIVKHEIAHHICRERHNDECNDHGPKFRAVCKEIGANAKAKESITSIKDRIGAQDHDKVVDKVKKLLALGSSDNPHEAELATLKANKILMKYNLSTTGSTENIYHKKLFKVGQKNAKNRTIMSILRTFGVFPVYSQCGSRSYIIEVSGSKANVEIADYVADFLNEEMERLYKKARKEGGFSGLAAKNAFFNGIASGYRSKHQKQEKEMEKEEGDNKLTVYKEEVAEKAEKLVYEKLKWSSSVRERGHSGANSSGYNAGKSLSIHKGVRNNSSGGTKLIG